MKGLITGITGFVGEYLAEHLIACGDEVAGSTFQDLWSDEITPQVRQQIPLFDWDLTQPIPAAVRDGVERFAPDCIYHLAAISVPAECGSAEPSELAQAVNVGGTRSVLELAGSLPSPPRVLVVSSAHVYAPVDPGDPEVTEDSPLGPTGAYGVTKLRAEEACRDAAAHGLDVVIIRAFQHSGPRQLPKFMLPEWAEQFARPGDDPVRVITLDSHNDLSDVRDVVRAYRLLMCRELNHRVYNVGSGRSVRSGDVFVRMSELARRPREALERSPGRRQHPIADISRLVADTAWQPQIPLDRTIADTLAYFQKRQEMRSS